MLNYEDLIAELRQRPLVERLSLLEILTQSIKQELTHGSITQPKPSAKFVKLSEFDSQWRPNHNDVAENKTWLQEAQTIAQDIAKKWPQSLSAADAVREDRREL